MSKWKQISGDMTWEKYGVLLAKVDGGSVELVRIDPWAEHDHDAQLTHGLYLVDEGSFDEDDLNVLMNHKKIASACQSVGMDLEEYQKLPIEAKAEVMAGWGGLGGDSKSTNNLLEALPDKPENIEFWGGKETTEKVEQYGYDERREAVQHHFDERLDFGEMPSDKALEFAIGDDGYTFELGDDNWKAGLGYAALFSKILDPNRGAKERSSISMDDAAQFTKIIEALVKAPTGEGATQNDMHKARKFFGLDVSYDVKKDEEDVQRLMTEASESARELATAMMEGIGFDWR